MLFVTFSKTYGVSFAVIHAERPGAAAEAVALGAEVLPVAGAAEHLAVVLSHAPRVQHLPAVCCNPVIENIVTYLYKYTLNCNIRYAQ